MIKEMKINYIPEFIDLFHPGGEVYVLSSLVDGSGTFPDFTTKTFERINPTEMLPLGEGGFLVGSIENPRWFVDFHGVVMESDSRERDLGSTIERAKNDSGLNEFLNTVGALSAFDPTKLSQVLNLVDAFLSLLIFALKDNGDDHIATFHDFYLKSQAFGSGRHPASGLRSFQGVELAYDIALEPL